MSLDIMTDLQNPNCHVGEILKRYAERKYKVHPINRGRMKFGQYHHLFGILRTHEIKFKEYMRMNVSTFDYVLSKVEKDLTRKWCNLHAKEKILPEEQLVVTIRFLATGMSYENLATTFLMGKSTVSVIVKRTLKALWENLYPIHMPEPSETDFLESAEKFYELRHLPHCLGAIDVRHVRIKKPKNTGSFYYNYKHFFSITLQAIVGPTAKYIAIDVGGYGSQHDSTTLKASTFYKALQKHLIKLPKKEALPGSRVEVPYFFIGDCAYPLMEHMLKPYPGNKLSDTERTFNKYLSGTRSVVERAFGQDCQRWRIYYTTIECEPETVELIVKGTSVLHNVIIDKEKEEGKKEIDNNGKTKKRKALRKISMEEEGENENEDGFPVGNGRENREIIKNYIVKQARKKRRKI